MSPFFAFIPSWASFVDHLVYFGNHRSWVRECAIQPFQWNFSPRTQDLHLWGPTCQYAACKWVAHLRVKWCTPHHWIWTSSICTVLHWAYIDGLFCTVHFFYMNFLWVVMNLFFLHEFCLFKHFICFCLIIEALALYLDNSTCFHVKQTQRLALSALQVWSIILWMKRTSLGERLLIWVPRTRIVLPFGFYMQEKGNI